MILFYAFAALFIFQVFIPVQPAICNFPFLPSYEHIIVLTITGTDEWYQAWKE